MSFFLKLVDETQMSKPPEATRHHYEKYVGLFIPQSHLVSTSSL